MKRLELLKRLQKLGWYKARSGKGSHDIFSHPHMKRPIPVPKHGSEIPEALAKTILAQARKNLKKNDRN